MADIPQEVREAAARLAAVSELRPLLLSGDADDHLYIEVCNAMFLAGKRAGMERAAEIAEAHRYGDSLADSCTMRRDHRKHIAQAIRSENDGHG